MASFAAEKKTQFQVIYDSYRFAGYFEGTIDALIAQAKEIAKEDKFNLNCKKYLFEKSGFYPMFSEIESIIKPKKITDS